MKSPCSRRKYGTVIFEIHRDGIQILTVTNNARVSTVCNARCIRDWMNVEPFTNSELGAEIHAEQAALINTGPCKSSRQILFLAGVQSTGQEIKSPRPCYTCLRMIAFAGYKSIYTYDGLEYSAKTVAQYMEEYDFIHAPDA